MKKKTEKAIVLFDGVCNLCNASIRFIIQHDKKNHFLFASLQSEKGKELLTMAGAKEPYDNSIVLLENEIIYKRSSAALRITRHLNGGYFLLYTLLLVPTFLRDAVYNLIARNRYKWFGKKDTCMVPSNAVKERFLV